MAGTLAQFNQLTDAEQYFEFFGLSYDPVTVNVNRLHILKHFANTIKELNKSFPDLTEAERLAQYQIALQQAYTLFRSTSGVEQKLFKVFNEKPQNVVMLSEITVQ